MVSVIAGQALGYPTLKPKQVEHQRGSTISERTDGGSFVRCKSPPPLTSLPCKIIKFVVRLINLLNIFDLSHNKDDHEIVLGAAFFMYLNNIF